MLESRPWFLKGTSAELMFVVQELQDASNYNGGVEEEQLRLGKRIPLK